MALLGMKKKQAFGQVPMMGAAPEAMTMGAPVQGMGQLPDIANMPAMTAQPMQDQKPAKFKPNLLGVIGDAMQVFGGGQATYMNGVREQQQRSELMRERAMQAQQERETGWQDWVAKEEYKRANPSPAQDDQITQYMRGAGIDPMSEAGQKLYATALQNKVNPPEYRQGPDGNFYRVNVQPTVDISQGLPAGFKVKGGQASPAPATFLGSR